MLPSAVGAAALARGGQASGHDPLRLLALPQGASNKARRGPELGSKQAALPHGNEIEQAFMMVLKGKEAAALSKAEAAFLAKREAESALAKSGRPAGPSPPAPRTSERRKSHNEVRRRQSVVDLEQKYTKELNSWLGTQVGEDEPEPRAGAGAEAPEAPEEPQCCGEDGYHVTSEIGGSAKYVMTGAGKSSRLQRIGGSSRRSSNSGSRRTSSVSFEAHVASALDRKEGLLKAMLSEDDKVGGDREDNGAYLDGVRTELDVYEDHLRKASPRREMFYDAVKITTMRRNREGEDDGERIGNAMNEWRPCSRQDPNAQAPLHDSGHPQRSATSSDTIAERESAYSPMEDTESSSSAIRTEASQAVCDELAASDQDDWHAKALSEYIKASRKAGIYPEPIVVFRSEMAERMGLIDLSSLGLGDAKLAQTASAALRTLPVRKLKLSGNRLTDAGAAELVSKVPFRGKKKAQLDLASNRVGVRTAEAISAICVDPLCDLMDLSLARNRLDGLATRRLFEALRSNESLRRLDLSYNVLGFDGALWIAELLSENITLNYLSLGWTGLTNKGARAVIAALASNKDTQLVSLGLANNAIGKPSRAVAKSAKHLTKFQTRESFAVLLSDLLARKEEHHRPKNRQGSDAAATQIQPERGPRDQPPSAGGGKARPSNGSSAQAYDLFRGCSLTHLDLSHNLLDEGTCERIAEALKGNTRLLGLHMAGNAAVVDALGFVERQTLLTNSDGNDPNLEMLDIISRLKGLPLETRQQALRRTWLPAMTCWVCAGWAPRRFTVCAPQGATVLLHTSFDTPAWAGFEMFQAATIAESQLETIKLRKIMARSTQLEEAAFDMLEYSCIRTCPPGQIAFFFTVDGRPVLSDVELQIPWQRVSAKEYAPVPQVLLSAAESAAPCSPRVETAVEAASRKERLVESMQLNVAITSARQFLRSKDHDKVVGASEAEDSTFFKLGGSHTWSFRRQSQLSELIEMERELHKQVELPDFDPHGVKLRKSGVVFCSRSRPRSATVGQVAAPLADAAAVTAVLAAAPAGAPAPGRVARTGKRKDGTRALFYTTLLTQSSESHLRGVFNRESVAVEIDEIVSSRQEQRKTILLLERHFPELVNIHRFYSALDRRRDMPQSACLLSFDGFHTFCEDIAIDFEDHAARLPSLFAQVQRSMDTRGLGTDGARPDDDIAAAASVDLDSSDSPSGTSPGGASPQSAALLKKDHEDPALDAAGLDMGELSRPRFLQALVRLAILQYADVEPRESEALARFLKEHVLRLAHSFDHARCAQDQVFHESLHKIFNRNMPMLLRTYGRFSGRFAGQLETAWMSLTEWLDMLRQSDLLTERNNFFSFRGRRAGATRKSVKYVGDDVRENEVMGPTTRTAQLMFTSALAVSPHDDLNTKYFKLGFLEFLVAFGFLCAYLQDPDRIRRYERSPSDGLHSARKFETVAAAGAQSDSFSTPQTARMVRLALRRSFSLA